ncbi:MAG: Hpt domain-containing protein [Rhodospirillales bacterium]|nr:Hpt domain-containing protein [Rhodospirillales bacterium]
MFVLFSKQADLAQDRLDQACENAQDEEWRSAAHKFKGAAANLGAERLSEVCFAAEIGFSQAQEVKRDCLSAIRRGYEDVRNFLHLRMQDAVGAVSGNALG